MIRDTRLGTVYLSPYTARQTNNLAWDTFQPQVTGSTIFLSFLSLWAFLLSNVSPQLGINQDIPALNDADTRHVTYPKYKARFPN